jgi:hypothetical protein
MAGEEAIVHYLTGYRTIGFPVTSNPTLIIATMSRHNVRYLIVYRDVAYPYFLPTEEDRLEIVQRSFPTFGDLALEAAGYRIFRIRSMLP